jgi:hypothetical protein
VLNLAGNEYDFGPVLFSILQECEHRRRSLPADDDDDDAAAAAFAEIARHKLAEIRACYDEGGGTAGYWHELECEILETALPQYARAAAAQTRLEQATYGLWRQGDLLSRVLLGLGGLTVGGIVVAVPFIPIFEDAFAFALAAGAFFYPELRRWTANWRYSRQLNHLIANAEAYQHRELSYVTEASLEAELRAVESAAPAPHAQTAAPANDGAHAADAGHDNPCAAAPAQSRPRATDSGNAVSAGEPRRQIEKPSPPARA